MSNQLIAHIDRTIIETTAKGEKVIPAAQPPKDDTLGKLKWILKNWDEIPVLDIGERVGGTGYIDFLNHDDMSSPIMRGEDMYGRPFVAFRLRVKRDLKSGTATYNIVETLFQRYRSGGVWVSGGRALTVLAHGVVTDDNLRALEKLVKTGAITTEGWGTSPDIVELV